MEKSLTGKDICSIVKACASSGVREITLGCINIKFGQAEEPVSNIHYVNQAIEETSSNSQSDYSTQYESNELTQDELDNLFHEDPVEYERRRIEDNNG